jgi:hypothetical protein
VWDAIALTDSEHCCTTIHLQLFVLLVSQAFKPQVGDAIMLPAGDVCFQVFILYFVFTIVY